MKQELENHKNIKECVMEAIEISKDEFLSLTKITEKLDETHLLSELKLFDESLNTVIFFTTLEQVIDKNLNKTIIIDWWQYTNEELITIKDLISFISKNLTT